MHRSTRIRWGVCIASLIVCVATAVLLIGPAGAREQAKTSQPQVVSPRLEEPSRAFLELRRRAHRLPSGEYAEPRAAAPVAAPGR